MRRFISRSGVPCLSISANYLRYDYNPTVTFLQLSYVSVHHRDRRRIYIVDIVSILPQIRHENSAEQEYTDYVRNYHKSVQYVRDVPYGSQFHDTSDK